jgi:hypothetical protein
MRFYTHTTAAHACVCRCVLVCAGCVCVCVGGGGGQERGVLGQGVPELYRGGYSYKQRCLKGASKRAHTVAGGWTRRDIKGWMDGHGPHLCLQGGVLPAAL